MAKTYLVTGATSGIGKAVYAHLAAQGHNIVTVVRDASRIKDLPAKPYAIIEADFANPEATQKAFAAYNGQLDGIIHAAGILEGKSMLEMPLEAMQRTLTVNTLAPMLMLQGLWNNLNDDACIILFGSISGHKGSYDDAYAASKGAIHSLVKSLSLKLAPKGRVIGIAPGMTEDTRMTNALIPGRFEETRDTRIPLKKAGQPEDLAALVDFVLSPSAAFMTGCIIDINGGQYLR